MSSSFTDEAGLPDRRASATALKVIMHPESTIEKNNNTLLFSKGAVCKKSISAAKQTMLV